MTRTVLIDGREYREEEGLSCAECGAEMRLGKDRFGVRYLPAQPCGMERCAGTLGAHPDGSPLGYPADRATKRARIEAHDAFDRIWVHGIMSRGEAYAWMKRELGLGRGEAHIAKLDREQCLEVVRRIREEFPQLFPFDE